MSTLAIFTNTVTNRNSIVMVSNMIVCSREYVFEDSAKSDRCIMIVKNWRRLPYCQAVLNKRPLDAIYYLRGAMLHNCTSEVLPKLLNFICTSSIEFEFKGKEICALVNLARPLDYVLLNSYLLFG
jgi:hypothetical protein